MWMIDFYLNESDLSNASQRFKENRNLPTVIILNLISRSPTDLMPVMSKRTTHSRYSVMYNICGTIVTEQLVIVIYECLLFIYDIAH